MRKTMSTKNERVYFWAKQKCNNLLKNLVFYNHTTFNTRYYKYYKLYAVHIYFFPLLLFTEDSFSESRVSSQEKLKLLFFQTFFGPLLVSSHNNYWTYLIKMTWATNFGLLSIFLQLNTNTFEKTSKREFIYGV